MEKYKKIIIDDNHCFLCGRKFNKKNIETKEHVFPQWLLNDFDIRNKKLSLLNNTFIKYDKLKVPCCRSCNLIMSNTIEKPMKEAVAIGYRKLITINRDTIFYWILKLSYGTLYIETRLKTDQTIKGSVSILEKEFISKDYITNRSLLLTINKKTKFVGKPYSLLLFNVDNHMQNKYWAYDCVGLDTYFMLINDIGIIISFSDNGINEKIFMNYDENRKILRQNLHVVQFFEICAKYSYKKILSKSDPILTFFEDEEKTVVVCYDVNVEYDEWKNSEYVEVFLLFQRFANNNLEKSEIYKDGKVATYLHDEKGDFYNMIKYENQAEESKSNVS